MKDSGYGEGSDEQKENTREANHARLEASYTFDRQGSEDMSVPAIVAQNQDEYAEQFFTWRRSHGGGDLWEALVRWEVIMFGRPLEPSAHGVLRFAVRLRLHSSGQPGLQVRRTILSAAERQQRFDEAIGKKARMLGWPGGKPTTEHEALLKEQAEEIRRQEEAKRENPEPSDSQ